MRVRLLSGRMRQGLRRLSKGDLYFALGTAASLVILQFWTLVPFLYQDDVPVLRVLFVPSLLVIVAALALASSIGLVTRTVGGFITSLVALCAVQAFTSFGIGARGQYLLVMLSSNSISFTRKHYLIPLGA